MTARSVDLGKIKYVDAKRSGEKDVFGRADIKRVKGNNQDNKR